RDAEALTEAARAVEVDPLSAIAHVNVAWTEYYCRRYERAIAVMEQALVLEPNFPAGQSRWWLGWFYDQNGMPEKAFASWQAMFLVSRPTAEQVAAHEKAFKTAGIKGYWESFLTPDLDESWDMWDKARIYARLGKKKEALAALAEGFEYKLPGLHYWHCDP